MMPNDPDILSVAREVKQQIEQGCEWDMLYTRQIHTVGSLAQAVIDLSAQLDELVEAHGSPAIGTGH